MNWTSILELGAEGVRLTLFGRKNKNALWSFKLCTDETTLMDKEDNAEKFRSKSKIVEGWHNAISHLNEMNPSWSSLTPLKIHPDYKAKVALAVFSQLPRENFIERWGEFFCLPSDESKWKKGLADPKHWKINFSAERLATTWRARPTDFPDKVTSVFNSNKLFAGAEFVMGLPEHKVPLRAGGRASQNDIWLLAKVANDFASVAVEGKVHESFDKTLNEWYHQNENTSGRLKRFEYLCKILALQDKCSVDNGSLRYQLFHRTASAIIEAENLGIHHALMLVHTFATDRTRDSFEDYKQFLMLFNVEARRDALLSSDILVGVNRNIHLHFAWVEGNNG